MNTRRQFIASASLLAAAAVAPRPADAQEPKKEEKKEEKKVGFAFVGIGSLTRNQLLPAIGKCKNARLAAWMGANLVVVEGDAARIITGSESRPLSAPAGLTTLVASSDGLWLAIGCADGRVLLLDDNGAVRLERVAHHGAVTALAFDLATNRLYSAGEDGPHSLILGWGMAKR